MAALGLGKILPQSAILGPLLLVVFVGVAGLAVKGHMSRRSLRAIAGVVFLVPMILTATLVLSDLDGWTVRANELRYETGSGPTAQHPLGTDRVGRDLCGALGLACAQSYLVAIVAATVAMVIGLGVGLMASSELLVARVIGKTVCEYFETVPQIVLIILAMAAVNLWIARSGALGPGSSRVLLMAGVIVGVSCVPIPARLVQRRFEELQTMPFVHVLRSYGGSPRMIRYRTLLRAHVLPELLHEAGVVFAIALVLESAMAYVYEVRVAGLGAGGYASLGQLLAQLRTTILFVSRPAIPGLVAALAVVSMSIAGAFLLGGSMTRTRTYAGQ